jgi:hypothetical protein
VSATPPKTSEIPRIGGIDVVDTAPGGRHSFSCVTDLGGFDESLENYPDTGNNYNQTMARKKATRKKKARAATRKKKVSRKGKKKTAGDLIISKSRTKAAAGINVSGDFYAALDVAVREMIATAEARAENNNRRTLRPHDL